MYLVISYTNMTYNTVYITNNCLLVRLKHFLVALIANEFVTLGNN